MNARDRAVHDADPTSLLVVVGGGPRATYLLQTLAQLLERGTTSWIRDVAIVNAQGPFGGGWVHDPALPGYALLNRSAQGLALGPDGSTLSAWQDDRRGFAVERDWATRAEHGVALGVTFRDALARLRACGVRTHTVTDLVTDVRVLGGAGPHGAAYAVHTRRHRPVVARSVALLVGHEAGHAGLLREHAPAPYPWRPGPVGGHVRVDGSGLSAIELALHLTEGSGGTFDRAGGCTYRRSGREPASVTLVSPSGLLPLPRPWDADRPGPPHDPVFLRPDRWRGPVTADRVMDAVVSELVLVHAAATGLGQIAELPGRVDRLRRLDQVSGWRRVAEALARSDGNLVPITDDPLFRAYVLREPGVREPRELVDLGVELAGRGLLGSPLSCAFESVLRHLRPVLQGLIDRRALPAGTDRQLRGALSAVVGKCVNGASRQTMSRIAALMADGVLDVARADRYEGRRDEVWLPGRIGAGTVPGAHTLTSHLVGTGVLFVGPSGPDGAAVYRGVQVDAQFRALAPDGRARPGLHVLGAPLEGFKSFQFSAAHPAHGHEVLADVRTVCESLLASGPSEGAEGAPDRRRHVREQTHA